MKSTRITKLFNIELPIIQGGMVWCSGWKLASAVSNQGGLGLIGAGSMYPEVLLEHIQKCKKATDKPFGVNLPLLYPDIELHIKHIIDENVPFVLPRREALKNTPLFYNPMASRLSMWYQAAYLHKNLKMLE